VIATPHGSRQFIERHDALLVFLQQYDSTLDAWQTTAAESRDRKTADKANSLIQAMTDCTFIVALCCAQKVWR